MRRARSGQRRSGGRRGKRRRGERKQGEDGEHANEERRDKMKKKQKVGLVHKAGPLVQEAPLKAVPVASRHACSASQCVLPPAGVASSDGKLSTDLLRLRDRPSLEAASGEQHRRRPTSVAPAECPLPLSELLRLVLAAARLPPPWAFVRGGLSSASPGLRLRRVVTAMVASAALLALISAVVAWAWAMALAAEVGAAWAASV